MDIRRAALSGLIFLGLASVGAAAEVFDIGLSTVGTRIDAMAVPATRRDAPVVVLLGSLQSDAQSSTDVITTVTRFEALRNRPVRLIAVPRPNPEARPLSFPPTGVAYSENAEANTLWRWLGAQAPDLVLVAGQDDAGLVDALGSQPVAHMGRIPARVWTGDATALAALAATPRSEARTERLRREARSPRELATQLARRYGHDFDQPWYIGALALVARIELGDIDDVRRLVESWVNGSKDSLARPNSLVMAGHVVFSELARRTQDSRYIDAVRKVAELGFDPQGAMREAMPYHEQYSDSVFMGTAIVAQAGSLTGERRYYDMADRHLRFMESLDLRADGLYRHQPAADAAWGRGNGFAALGLAMSLAELPQDHPGHAHALEAYRHLMDALLPHQTRDGLWRNVVDVPGAYAEFSSTAMIGYALQRGLRAGWIRGTRYKAAADRAWQAVNARSGADGSFIDVCESTTRLTSVQQYVQRAAILGEDARGGAMALLFATERMKASPR